MNHSHMSIVYYAVYATSHVPYIPTFNLEISLTADDMMVNKELEIMKSTLNGDTLWQMVYGVTQM